MNNINPAAVQGVIDAHHKKQAARKKKRPPPRKKLLDMSRWGGLPERVEPEKNGKITFKSTQGIIPLPCPGKIKEERLTMSKPELLQEPQANGTPQEKREPPVPGVPVTEVADEQETAEVEATIEEVIDPGGGVVVTTAESPADTNTTAALATRERGVMRHGNFDAGQGINAPKEAEAILTRALNDGVKVFEYSLQLVEGRWFWAFAGSVTEDVFMAALEKPENVLAREEALGEIVYARASGE